MRLSRTRSRLITLLALLASVGQLAVSVIAPIADGRAGQSAPAHVEEQGVTQHYAHDEATCIACTATTLRSLPSFGRAEPPRIARTAGRLPSAPERGTPLSTRHQTSPRAPPSVA